MLNNQGIKNLALIKWIDIQGIVQFGGMPASAAEGREFKSHHFICINRICQRELCQREL